MNEAQIASALAEYIYNRNDNDNALTLADIGGANIDIVVPDGIFSSGGRYYTNKGFVGAAVEVDGKIYIVFRGSDSAESFMDGISKVKSDIEGDNPSLVDETFLTDLGDFYSNYHLGSGTIKPTQLDDAIAFAEAVKSSGNVAGKEIIITGQSLGGGLAGLVSAILGLPGIAISPAPFANQLIYYAIAEAMADISDIIPEQLKDLKYNPSGIVGQGMTFLEAVRDSWESVSGILKHFGIAENDVSAIIEQAQDSYSKYKANIVKELQVHTVKGEFLTLHEQAFYGLFSDVVESYVTHFREPTTSYDVGQDAGAFDLAGPSISLHSPTLHALVIRTHELGDMSFEAVLKNNDALRYALIENQEISGALTGDRMDPAGVGSGVRSSSNGYDTGILFRELWKSVKTDGAYYQSFYDKFVVELSAGLSSSHITGIYDAFVYMGLYQMKEHYNFYNYYSLENLVSLFHLDGMSGGFIGLVGQGELTAARDILNTAFLGMLGPEASPFLVNQMNWEVAVTQKGSEALFYQMSPSGSATNNGQTSSHLVFGGITDDFMAGSNNTDFISGGKGDDYIEGRGGADILIGGDNSDVGDTVSYRSSSNGVMIDLAGSQPQEGGDAEGDILIGFENVAGSAFRDIILGNYKNNKLSGNGGSDFLYGGEGNDVLDGGSEDDIIVGGEGDDTFYAGLGNDRIFGGLENGEDTGEDTLILSGKRSDYTINYIGSIDNPTRLENASGVRIIDNRQFGEGTDIVRGVEKFFFTGDNVTIDFEHLVNQAPTIWAEADTIINEGLDAGHWLSEVSAFDANGDAYTIALAPDSVSDFMLLTGSQLTLKSGAALDYEAFRGVLDQVFTMYSEGLSFSDWVAKYLTNDGTSADLNIRSLAVNALKSLNGPYVANLIVTDALGASAAFDYIVHVQNVLEGPLTAKFSSGGVIHLDTIYATFDGSISAALSGSMEGVDVGATWSLTETSQGVFNQVGTTVQSETISWNYDNWASAVQSIWQANISSQMTLGEWVQDIRDGHSSISHDVVSAAMLAAGFGFEVNATFEGKTTTHKLILSIDPDVAAFPWGLSKPSETDINVIEGSEGWSVTGGFLPEPPYLVSELTGDLGTEFRLINSQVGFSILTFGLTSYVVYSGSLDDIGNTLSILVEAKLGTEVHQFAVDIPVHLISMNEFHGGTGRDVVEGSNNFEIFYGNAGDDIFYWTPGGDNIDGGSGVDTIDFSKVVLPPDDGFYVTLGGGENGHGSASTNIESGQLTSIENMVGSMFNDYVWGDSGRNVISTGAGDDQITTGGGTDVIRAGSGDDIVYADMDSAAELIDGGAGNDIVYLEGEWSDWRFSRRQEGGANYIIGSYAGNVNEVRFANIENFIFADGNWVYEENMTDPVIAEFEVWFMQYHETPRATLANGNTFLGVPDLNTATVGVLLGIQLGAHVENISVSSTRFTYDGMYVVRTGGEYDYETYATQTRDAYNALSGEDLTGGLSYQAWAESGKDGFFDYGHEQALAYLDNDFKFNVNIHLTNGDTLVKSVVAPLEDYSGFVYMNGRPTYVGEDEDNTFVGNGDFYGGGGTNRYFIEGYGNKVYTGPGSDIINVTFDHDGNARGNMGSVTIYGRLDDGDKIQLDADLQLYEPGVPGSHIGFGVDWLGYGGIYFPTIFYDYNGDGTEDVTIVLRGHANERIDGYSNFLEYV